MLKRTAIFIFILAATSFAQSPSKILKKAETALGGTKVLKARNSLVVRGRITRLDDHVSGSFQMETSRPNSFHVRYDIGGDEVEYGYNGRSAWRRTSGAGLQTLTGSDNLELQAQASFRNWLWLNAKQEKLTISSAGPSSVDKNPTNNVAFTTPKGVRMKVFFDAASGIPRREEFGGEAWECTDHRLVDGSQIPFRCSIEMSGKTYELAVETAMLNQALDRTAFDFPKTVGQPLPELTKLLAELQANQERVENLLDTYSYTRKVVSREVGKDGKLGETESETQQMSFYKGYRIERTIEKNGKPLSASDQADEDKAVAKRAEEIEKRIAKAEKNGTNQDDVNQRSVSIAELLRASRLINPRRERFRGRDVIVFDFEPNPNFDYKNAKSMLKFFGKTAGAIWVDENDKQTVRVEAFLADDFSVGGGVLVKLKKGATFTAEQERVNDEIWLPSLMEINLSARVLLLKGIAVNQVVRSYDYRKFQTEVKDAKVNEIQKP